MTHKKRPSTEKMYDYKNEKAEFARELGINGANKTEVNAKLANYQKDLVAEVEKLKAEFGA